MCYHIYMKKLIFIVFIILSIAVFGAVPAYANHYYYDSYDRAYDTTVYLTGGNCRHNCDRSYDFYTQPSYSSYYYGGDNYRYSNYNNYNYGCDYGCGSNFYSNFNTPSYVNDRYINGYVNYNSYPSYNRGYSHQDRSYSFYTY
jgi:hypothetical protein